MILRILLVMILNLGGSAVCLAQAYDANTQQMLDQIKQMQAKQSAQAAQINQNTQNQFNAAAAQVPGLNPEVAATAAQAPLPSAISAAPIAGAQQPATNQPAQPAANPPPASPQAASGYINLSNPTGGQASPTFSAPATPAPHFATPFDAAVPADNSMQQMIRDQAFGTAVGGALPMTPSQIHRLKQLYTASQYAASAPAGVPPQPTASSIYVNLAPGATPPVIRLTEGFVTSLVFLDASGAPWPLAAYDIGNPGAFDIQWNKKDNVLMIQAKSLYTYGNLAVRLQDLGPPVMLTLIPGQQIVDYRVDITVPSYGPQAKTLPMGNGLPPTESPDLLKVLDGIPPSGSKELIVSDKVGQAWLLADKLYFRTRYTLLSPGWVASMSSADGMNAYELPKTPTLLLAENGKVVHIKVEGY